MRHKHWQIDKRIPVAVLIAVFLHLMGALIWATELGARVDNIERQNLGMSNANERYARMEERLEALRQDLLVIRKQLDRINDRLMK